MSDQTGHQFVLIGWNPHEDDMEDMIVSGFSSESAAAASVQRNIEEFNQQTLGDDLILEWHLYDWGRCASLEGGHCWIIRRL